MIFTKTAKLKIENSWTTIHICLESGVLGRQLWGVDSQQKSGDAAGFAYTWDHLQVSQSQPSPDWFLFQFLIIQHSLAIC